jgi:DNA polymerase (family 10)
MRELLKRFLSGKRSEKMTNEEIARRFEQLAQLMEIRGEDRFRTRSYRNAAEVIETWHEPIESIAREEGARELQKIPGVGKAIAGKILDLIERGTFDAWERITAETPLSTLDLLKVDGIGMTTASNLHRQFKIKSLDDLRQFIAGGGLELVDGIGEKTAARIEHSLRQIMSS